MIEDLIDKIHNSIEQIPEHTWPETSPFHWLVKTPARIPNDCIIFSRCCATAARRPTWYDHVRPSPAHRGTPTSTTSSSSGNHHSVMECLHFTLDCGQAKHQRIASLRSASPARRPPIWCDVCYWYAVFSFSQLPAPVTYTLGAGQLRWRLGGGGWNQCKYRSQLQRVYVVNCCALAGMTPTEDGCCGCRRFTVYAMMCNSIWRNAPAGLGERDVRRTGMYGSQVIALDECN